MRVTSKRCFEVTNIAGRVNLFYSRAIIPEMCRYALFASVQQRSLFEIRTQDHRHNKRDSSQLDHVADKSH